MKINFKIKLTKTQQKAYNLLHDEDTQYLVCNWSRQCGKSVFAEISLIEYLCTKNTFNAYISPSFSQGRKVYSELTKLLEGKNIIKKANASTLTIESYFGSTLQFFSLESPTAIRGYTVSGLLVMDEASFYPDTLTDGSEPYSSVIMPITKARKPKVLVISTPKGKRGMFHTLYNKALSNEKGFKYIKATIYDDELVNDEEIKRIKSLVSPISFQEEFLCEFLDSSLTYFQGFEHCFTVFKYNGDTPQHIGIDLSSNGKDETILTLVNSLKQIKQIPIKGTLDEKYNAISNIINNTRNLKGVYIENNGIGAPMINEIRKLVKNKQIISDWTTTNESKKQIISNLALRISNKEIFFDEEDKELFSQLSTFIVKYSKKGNVQFEAQQGFHDDRVLSLAIALRAQEDLRMNTSYNFTQSKYIRIE